MTNILSRVISFRKRQELLDVLHRSHPTHNQRLWLVGFLQYAGYSESEIRSIIHSENMWRNYVKPIAAIQIHSVVARRRHRGTGESYGRLFCLTAEGLIDEFLKNTDPVKRLDVPWNTREAAVYYYEKGFTPVPKHRTEKRPSIRWEIYQDLRPTLANIMTWDWSNGICLVANDELSFLDIDKSGYSMLFCNRHYETTPRGGTHVFGKGKIRNYDEEGIGELKGKGRLIVAYPTPGYKLAGEV